MHLDELNVTAARESLESAAGEIISLIRQSCGDMPWWFSRPKPWDDSMQECGITSKLCFSKTSRVYRYRL